jgi:hypothetical protein
MPLIILIEPAAREMIGLNWEQLGFHLGADG